MEIRKGDTVDVITGKDKGKRGKVLRVVPEQERLVVEGVNKQKRHQKASAKVMQAGIITREGPVHASNVMVHCPKCHAPTRIGHRMEGERKIRVCRRCGESLDR